MPICAVRIVISLHQLTVRVKCLFGDIGLSVDTHEWSIAHGQEGYVLGLRSFAAFAVTCAE